MKNNLWHYKGEKMPKKHLKKSTFFLIFQKWISHNMQFLRYCHSYFDLEEVIGPELVHRQAYPTFASLFDMTASSNQYTKNICEAKKLISWFSYRRIEMEDWGRYLRGKRATMGDCKYFHNLIHQQIFSQYFHNFIHHQIFSQSHTPSPPGKYSDLNFSA